MSMVLKRIWELVFVILGVSTIIFFLQRLIPGSPADTILGPDASDLDKNVWLIKYGFNKPLYEQYFIFLKNIVSFDFGRSFMNYKPVTEIIFPRLLQTLKLASISFTFSILIASCVGILSALHEGKTIDKLCALISLLMISAPSFIIGPILIWIFSVKLNLLPLVGDESFLSYILPSITLGSSLAAFSSRMVRSGIVDTLKEDYIRTALSKGLSYKQVIVKHAFRNAFLPTLTILGLQLGVLLSGTVITEQIFNWPGLGSLVVESVGQREYNIVSGCVILMAIIYVTCNLFVDILYRFFDPRVRLS